jgi:hypothetical protein
LAWGAVAAVIGNAMKFAWKYPNFHDTRKEIQSFCIKACN